MLTLFAECLPGAGAPTLVDQTPYMESLQMSSVAPGGCEQLTATLRLPTNRARVPRPETGVLTGRVAVRDGGAWVWAGEIHESALLLDRGGEALAMVALGGGTALSDDPLDTSYTGAGTTAKGIVADQFSRRSVYLAVDADQTLVLPANPAATFTPAFSGKTLEDVLHELSDLLGDYVWGVWPHAMHRDALGLPTWQLAFHARDVSTVSYRAGTVDLLSYRIAPSAVRAYNGITVGYHDPVLGPGYTTVYDARLGAGYAQGSAPFRLRRLRRDFGSWPLTNAQATAIANGYLASMENIGNVITVELAAVRDAAGRPVPLTWVRADTNILIPDLLPRLNQLSVGVQPGGNLFYIRKATYKEQRGRVPTLTLQLDQVADLPAIDLVRLRYAEQLRTRAKRAGPALVPAGLPIAGQWGISFVATGPGQVFGAAINFGSVLSRPPTSLSFALISSANIGGGPTVTAGSLTVWGCHVTVQSSASGAGDWIGTWLTVGN